VVSKPHLKLPPAAGLRCPAKRDLRQFYYIKVHHRPL
jgi:hypothetical protein